MPKGVVNCGNCVSLLFGKTFEEIGGGGATRLTKSGIVAAFEVWTPTEAFDPSTGITAAHDANAVILYFTGGGEAASYVTRAQWSAKSLEINGTAFDTLVYSNLALLDSVF